jgi:hypothetical protein
MLLAEKLLLAKGYRIPHREKDVLLALETLREPPGVVNRRKARQYAIQAAGISVGIGETGELGIRGGSTMIGNPEGVSITDQAEHTMVRHSPGYDETHVDWNVISPTGQARLLALSAHDELLRAVPPELRRYLTADVDQEVLHEQHTFLRALMSTGGIYRVDGGEDGAQGVLDSIWGGLPFTELPPLPYPRMWFEARGPSGDFMPLWHGTPPEDVWNANDTSELWGLGITEVVPGQSWGIIVVRKDDWEYVASGSGGLDDPADYYQRTSGHRFKDGSILSSLRYERVDLHELLTVAKHPDALFIPMDADQPMVADSEYAYRGAMLAWAVVLADMVTARNVDRRETFLPRKALKQMHRAAPRQRFESRIYNVSIATATSDAKDETGNYLTVRFLVRGHWRVSTADHAKWQDSKGAYCVWIAGYVKGPAGAPWKGRPIYTEPGTV